MSSGIQNPVVEQIGQIHFEGNITPHAWYQSPRLQNEAGKPNLVAITLLADVIYWYRPVILRDEVSGQEIGRRQKFSADKLQKNYEKWGQVFGLTKRQVEDAMAFLKARGLVTVETRAVVTEYGTFPNCAFIEPVLPVIQALTFPASGKGLPDENTGPAPSPEKTGDRPRKNGRRLPENGGVPPEKTGVPGLFSGRRLPENRDHSKTPSETTTKNKQKAPPAPPGVLPSAVSGEEGSGPEEGSKAEQDAVSLWPFDLLPEEERAPWLDKAEKELRENFGAAVWAKTKEKGRAAIRERRAVSLYQQEWKGK